MPSNFAGYLTPSTNPPVDDAFENFLHDVFVGITGIANELVRPRWQPEPPNQPDIGADWLAFGIMNFGGDDYSYQTTDEMETTFERHETVELLLSFYGPNSMKNLLLLRDGLLIEQNREALGSVGIGLTGTGDGRPSPVIPKDRWIKRWDITVTLRRMVRRTYPVLSLLSAQGVLHNEKYDTNLVVNP